MRALLFFQEEMKSNTMDTQERYITSRTKAIKPFVIIFFLNVFSQNNLFRGDKPS